MIFTDPSQLLADGSPFRLLVDHAPVMFWVSRADAGSLLLNHGWRNFRGLSSDNTVPDGWAHGIHDEDRAEAIRCFEDAHRHQQPYSAEYRVRRADGLYRWVRDHGLPWFDNNREFMGEMGCCIDITEQHARPLTAGEAEHRLTHLVESSQDLVYRIQVFPTLAVEYMGGAVERITGYPAEQWYADASLIYRAVHPDDLPLLATTPAMAAQQSQTATCRWTHADGRIVWAEHYRIPMFNAAGHVVGIAGIARDVSQRVDIELKLRASEEQMRQLAARVQQAREEERADVSRELHDDLGQTLTALKLEITRAVSTFASDPPNVSTVDRLQTIVGLVDLGIGMVKRISARLRPATLDHLGLVEAVRAEASTFMARTGIRTRVRANRRESNLTAEQQTALFRIVQEALNNVVCHANASAVRVSVHETDESVEMRVRDNGRGITAAEAAAPGSIGLLGMKERAALVGGTFSVAGQRGKGTVVSVIVPLRESLAYGRRANSESELG